MNDGEFWMNFDDFFMNFHQLQICHRGPGSLGTTENEASTYTWKNLYRVNELFLLMDFQLNHVH